MMMEGLALGLGLWVHGSYNGESTHMETLNPKPCVRIRRV